MKGRHAEKIRRMRPGRSDIQSSIFVVTPPSLLRICCEGSLPLCASLLAISVSTKVGCRLNRADVSTRKPLQINDKPPHGRVTWTWFNCRCKSEPTALRAANKSNKWSAKLVEIGP